jgi:hypothetical protein
MDPQELANLFEKKNAKRAARAAEEKSKSDAKADWQMRAEQGRVALREVVIPYFQELVETFPKGQVKFDQARVDAATGASTAVSFKIGDSAEHVIEVIHGNVRIWRPRSDRPPFDMESVFSGNAEPLIAGPSDLTREKLSKLVEMVINEL